MKFLKAYWMLIIAIITGYFYYDLTMQIAEKEAKIRRLETVGKVG